MPTIIEMVTHTRLDCVIGSAAGMRRGVAEAVNHARGRSAFGSPLVEKPLMLNVLADLAIESEAATATALRLARAYDEEDNGSAASPPRCSSTGSASARRRTRSRRSSASAATATSRRARCRSCCATRR